MAKKKKTKKPLSKFEMIFCIGSLLIMIVFGLYYGYRSFYYYSKQNFRLVLNQSTLNGSIVDNNKLITSGDGFHQDENGYYFKGNVVNNYVKYSNRLFRVIRVNNDNSVKVISDKIGTSFMWGIDSNYENSNINAWLDKSEIANSGVYYNTLGGPDKFLDKMKYTIDKLEKDKVVSGKKEYTSLITTLSLNDYNIAGGKNSYLNIGKAFWLLGYRDDSNLFVSEDGSIEDTSSYEAYGIRPVITFSKNTKIVSGTGTMEDPYIIDQGPNINGVDNYVRLGNDIWKIYKDDPSGYYSMYFVNSTYKSPFDLRGDSEFDLKNKNNLGYYLNSMYFYTLTYRDYLLPTNWNVGEVSLDTDYNIYNNYSETILSPIGILNIFDYYNEDSEDMYYINNIGSKGMIYKNTKDGYLEEQDVKEYSLIVPCISIRKGIIRAGTGTKEDPYTV